MTAGAGATLSAVMNFAKRAGLSGLEFSAGIPGTFGGALAGNAGTAGGDVCGLVESVEVIDVQGRHLWRPRGSFQYGYRHSALRNDLILGATLSLHPDEPAAIKARIDAALSKRGEQPLGVRCSGCMFKNPTGDYAGRLIDTTGLKGLRNGGARVSDLHANFIINDGTATAGDICTLIERIRREVLNRHGIHLDLEIRIVGLDSGEKIV
jgi:UDP-N-acetylmuramate dehydrogenase